MAKILAGYGIIAVTLQVITFSYTFYGLLGVIIALTLFPLAALVTSIGAFVVFGSGWAIFNLIILVGSLMYITGNE